MDNKWIDQFMFVFYVSFLKKNKTNEWTNTVLTLTHAFFLLFFSFLSHVLIILIWINWLHYAFLLGLSIQIVLSTYEWAELFVLFAPMYAIQIQIQRIVIDIESEEKSNNEPKLPSNGSCRSVKLLISFNGNAR